MVIVFKGKLNLALERTALNIMLEILNRQSFVLRVRKVVVGLSQKNLFLNAPDLVVRLHLLYQVLKLYVFSDLKDLPHPDLLFLEGNVSHVD